MRSVLKNLKMKKIKESLMLTLAVILLQFAAPQKLSSAPLQATVSFQFFYDELSPYGNWVSYPDYGYAWVPAAGPGFRPYLTNGHWVLTDQGWMWVSYYDWGWAPFHYGSWVMDPQLGWIWIPGYNWAPAWVTWGNYDGYYGWAPVGPGFSFTVSTYYPPLEYWCFMHPRYITAPSYTDHYYVAHDRRIVLGSNTRVINNVEKVSTINNLGKTQSATFNAGPRRTDFENAAQTKVQQVSLRDSEKPGKAVTRENAIDVYRPRVAKETVAAEKPAKVSGINDIKRSRPALNSPTASPSREPISPGSAKVKPESSPVQGKQPSNVRRQQIPPANNNNDREIKSGEPDVRGQQKQEAPEKNLKEHPAPKQVQPSRIPERNVRPEIVPVQPGAEPHPRPSVGRRNPASQAVPRAIPQQAPRNDDGRKKK
jgi:hypothetical protein